MIKAVLFDLDRTLLDRDTSFLDFVTSQYEKFSQQLAHIPRAVYISRVVALDNHGLLWKDQVYKTLVQEFDIQSLGWEQLFADFDARIADYYLPFPQLREMLVALRQHGYKLGIVTNGKGYFQRRTILALGIEQDFDVILISEEEGLRKPDVAIFHRALARIDCEPHEGVFVGDSIEADIRGAQNAGMLAIWKKDLTSDEGTGDKDTADAVLEDLKDLPAILKQLTRRNA